MEFAPASRPRAPRESVVPMINVVFLLLIFFLMTAQIAPPDPVDVTPPSVTLADGPVPEDAGVLWLGPEGDLLTAEGTRPDLTALEAQVTLRADADAPAADLARALRQLGQGGARSVTLVARQGDG
ncbi:MAG: biopolymer transporter ExbD [Alphaproteobacteria bacterium]|nr:biopolymer transporter ExbD [Alphaproteobacteria bacterium]